MGSLIHREDFFARVKVVTQLERDIERVREIAEQEIARVEAEWKGRLNAKRERINELLTRINQSVRS